MAQKSIELVEHPARPTWGRCLVSAERDGKVFLVCEDGEEHALAATHKSHLKPLALVGDEIGKAVLAIEQRRAAALGKRIPRGKPRKTAPKAPRATFDQQIQRFETAFPGGFTGEAYTADRAARDGIVAKAKELFGKASLEGDVGYDRTMSFLQDTKLIHPMEGTIALKTMPADTRAGFTDALRDLLHGSGDATARFDAFVAAVKLMKPDGELKRPSWPFVTMFAGFYSPVEQAYIKPKLLLEQAAILAETVDYDPLPSGKAYDQLVHVLKVVSKRLADAGQKPRDLVDAATFVLTTLAPQAAAPAPAEDAEPA